MTRPPGGDHPPGSARRALRWCVARDQRGYVLAVATGLALRLAWVVWLRAVEPIEAFSDTGRNLAMARQFADFQTYRLNGLVSAFNPPGYPLLLAPVAFVSRVTGWFGLPLGAALVNVAAGTATVALGGLLAQRWFGRTARTAVAWLLAVAAGPIYLTAVALTETVFTALVVAGVVLISAWVLRNRPIPRRSLLGVGALIGFSALVRPPGLLLLLVGAVALRQARGSWRSAARPALAMTAMAVLVVAPWTIRNAVQVGVVTPVSTNSAAFLCQGHGPDAKADVEDMVAADWDRCFRHSPFDPSEPDEAEWAPHITRLAAGWALTHPLEEVELTWDKTYATMVNDHQALADSRDGARRDVAAADTIHRLDRLAEWWHRVALIGGVLALVLLRRARRAWPIWATAGGLVVAVWFGNALDRYHHTTMALLAVLAGALVASFEPGRAARWVTMGWRRRRDRIKEQRAVRQEQRAGPDDQPDAPPDEGDPDLLDPTEVPGVPDAVEAGPAERRGAADAEPSVSPAEALAVASRPAGPWAGPYGRPFHPMVAAVAVGAWVCAFGFDLISQVADTAWVYARGAYVLTAAGVGVGVVAAMLGLADLVRIPRDTRAFRTGVRHLLSMDACLVLFAVSFLVRRTSDFEWHDPVAIVPMGLSVVGLAVLAVGVWLGARLSYTYGVRVALEPDRLRGFETEDRR